MSVKIHNKSKSWWKHGKHSGNNLEASIMANRQKIPKRAMEPIDLKKTDWSSNKKH